MKKVLGTICWIIVFCLPALAQEPEQDILCFNYRCFKPEKQSETIVEKHDTTKAPEINPTVTEDYTFITSGEKEQDTTANVSKYFANLDQWKNDYNKRFMNVASRDLQLENQLEATRPVIPLVFFNRPKCRVELFPEDEFPEK